MKVFETISVAFSMFSHIPMPRTDWTPDNMRYAMCAFPLIGGAIGLAVWGWWALCGALGLGPALSAAGMTLIPPLLTGGIHLDGYCDACDALASHAPAERKLEIMKDSHAGAFAALGAAGYFLLYFALCFEFRSDAANLWSMGLVYALCRTLSGLATATFRCAKSSGLLHAFADAAAKRRVGIVLGLLAAALGAGLLLASPARGIGVLLAAALCFAYYRRMSYRQFGGITGDLAGFFLQICELACLAALVVVQGL